MMSARGAKSKTPEEAAMSRIPKLPPIQQFVQASSRFDNSPLLKYRRSSDVQDLLGNIVRERAKNAKEHTEDYIKKRPKSKPAPELPSQMMSRERRIRLNYQFLKKCVSEGPVSPMPGEWWSEILSMVPEDLVKAPEMQPYIKELYEELMTDYDKSMRKAMVQYTLVKPKVKGVELDEDMPDDELGLDFSSTWRDSFLAARALMRRNLHILHPSHQTILKICNNRNYSKLLLVDLSDIRKQGPIECEHLKNNSQLACEKIEEKLMHSWYPEIVNIFVDTESFKHLKDDQQDSFHNSVSTLISNQLKEIILRTLKKFTSLFDEKDATRLPLFKMELILDDDDNIQFYPMLEDLEDSILSVVNSITGTLQNVQSVQSWLSGGPVSVNIDAKIDAPVVQKVVTFLKGIISGYLEGPRKHLASFDKYSMLVDGRSATELQEFLETDHSFEDYTVEIEKYRTVAREISSLVTVARFDIMRLDCDDLKRGLASKAHGYAEKLLARLAEDHRKESQRICTAFESMKENALRQPKDTKEMIDPGKIT
eukprot:Seg2081.2 transcript_id=Seg2081.2/GoldUCD/mRNA.D3Y31 product="Dynein heavy chain 12 axonemal" protein_id=Seg2081.2/GoldUCD/D3Y31